MSRKRFGRLLPLLALGAAVGLIAGVAPSTAATEVTYTFEQCAEGWTFQENNVDAPGGDWTRQPPGHASTYAFRMAPYPIGAGSPSDNYEATITSKAHSFAGGTAKVTWYVSHDLETDFDYMHLERSSNGTIWTQVVTVTGVSEGYPAFHEQTASFSHPAGALYLRFHLTSDQLLSGNGGAAGQIAVDNIIVPTARPSGAACDGGGGGEPPPPPPKKKCTKSGNSGNNRIRGTSKPDTLCGKAGNDRLEGLGSGDKLLGGSGKDRLRGGPGKDVLNGGKGRDVCKGGAGRDTYRSCEKKT